MVVSASQHLSPPLLTDKARPRGDLIICLCQTAFQPLSDMEPPYKFPCCHFTWTVTQDLGEWHCCPLGPTFMLMSSFLRLPNEWICDSSSEQKSCCFPSGCFVVSVAQTSEKSAFPTQHRAKIDCCLPLIKQPALRLSSNWKTENLNRQKECVYWSSSIPETGLHHREWVERENSVDFKYSINAP